MEELIRIGIVAAFALTIAYLSFKTEKKDKTKHKHHV